MKFQLQIISFFSKHRLLLSIVLALLLHAPSWAQAANEIEQLMGDGISSLTEGSYQQALEAFQEIEELDPTEARAFFLQGLALNRLEEHKKACSTLDKATTLGEQHAELSFEKGWCLFKSERYEDARREFEIYEQEHPERGKTSEFLGRTYYHLGSYDQAANKLKEAIKRDPQLEDGSRIYLVHVEQARNNETEVEKHWGLLIAKSRNDKRLAGVLDPVFGVQTGSPKPWQVSFLFSLGYNDNVIGLSNQSLLPQNISRQDSQFARSLLSGHYDWVISPKNVLRTSSTLYYDYYRTLHSFDYFDHYVDLQFFRHWHETVTSNFKIGNNYSFFGGNLFRNQINGGTSLTFRPTEWALTDISYLFQYSKYFDKIPSAQNRDGTSHNITVRQYIKIPWTQSAWINVGASYTKTMTKGTDFDSKTKSLFAGFDIPLFWKIEVNGSSQLTFERFDNINSLTNPAVTFPPFLPTFVKRKDDSLSISGQLSRPIPWPWENPWWESFKFFIRYDYFNVRSNIDLFSYVNNTYTSGVILSF